MTENKSVAWVSAIFGGVLAAIATFLLTTYADPAIKHKPLTENVRVTS